MAGLDSFRWDWSKYELNSYKVNCSIFEEALLDLKTSILFLSKQYKSIILIAHSLGVYLALATLIDICRNVKMIILWEPSLPPYIVLGCNNMSNNHIKTLFCKTEIDSIKNSLTDLNYLTKLSNDNKIPILMMIAEKGGMKMCNKNFAITKQWTTWKLIQNADHGFNNINTEQLLFKETKDFIFSEIYIKKPIVSNDGLGRGDEI